MEISAIQGGGGKGGRPTNANKMYIFFLKRLMVKTKMTSICKDGEWQRSVDSFWSLSKPARHDFCAANISVKNHSARCKRLQICVWKKKLSDNAVTHIKQLPSLGCAEHLLLDPLHLHYSQVFDYMSKFLVDRNLSLKLNFTHSAFWKRIGFDVAHPGVDKTQDPLERRYHKYYQWVCFCLFFQVSFLH